MAIKEIPCTCHKISQQDRLVYNDNVDYFCPWCDGEREDATPVKKAGTLLTFNAHSRMRGGGFLTFWTDGCGKKLIDVLSRFHDNGYTKQEFYFLIRSL